MRLPHVRARVVVFLAAGGLLLPGLAACSDDAPEASPAPSASASASESAPAAPELPAAAKGDGPKAAEAFVRHYVDLINHALETLDHRPLALASTTGCEACQYFTTALRTTKNRNGHYEGGHWRVLALEDYPHGADGEYNIRARVRIEAERVIHRQPRDVARFPQRESIYNFIVRERGQALQVSRIIGVEQ
jgi:hypothetical protein